MVVKNWPVLEAIGKNHVAMGDEIGVCDVPSVTGLKASGQSTDLFLLTHQQHFGKSQAILL